MVVQAKEAALQARTIRLKVYEVVTVPLGSILAVYDTVHCVVATGVDIDALAVIEKASESETAFDEVQGKLVAAVSQKSACWQAAGLIETV